jgi:anti-anti-sigma factor
MSQITLDTADGTAKITVHGNFVFDLNRAFREAYQQVPAGQRIIVDLSRSQYVDSAGLGMLLRLREHAGGSRDSVTLDGANDTVRLILDVANFGQLFRIR